MNNTIFTVVLVDICKYLKTLDGLDIARRTVGWFRTFEDANESIINNVLDINEGETNEYIILEEIQERMYGDSINIWFYEFNKNTKKYEQCERPVIPKCKLGYDYFDSCNYCIG